jgi:hypothetical protein
VIDVNGSGISLTDAEHGVLFRWGDTALRTAWTLPGSDNAWLALDRNGDGLIDNASELFGNFTPQPPPPPAVGKNGFNALRVFDDPRYGGNGDGILDRRDAAYARLRLWQDKNHNGISEPDELFSLEDVGVGGISLQYETSERTDEYGNHFRYRAKIYNLKGFHEGQWAWDVVLRTAKPAITTASPSAATMATK